MKVVKRIELIHIKTGIEWKEHDVTKRWLSSHRQRFKYTMNICISDKQHFIEGMLMKSINENLVVMSFNFVTGFIGCLSSSTNLGEELTTHSRNTRAKLLQICEKVQYALK